MRLLGSASSILLIVCLTACSGGSVAVTDTGCTGTGEVIQASCMPCHSASGRSGGLDFETDWYGTWIGDGLVVPGDSANSIVYERMINAMRPMPPSGVISAAYLTIVQSWIDGGAVCPDGAATDSGGDSGSDSAGS